MAEEVSSAYSCRWGAEPWERWAGLINHNKPRGGKSVKFHQGDFKATKWFFLPSSHLNFLRPMNSQSGSLVRPRSESVWPWPPLIGRCAAWLIKFPSAAASVCESMIAKRCEVKQTWKFMNTDVDVYVDKREDLKNPETQQQHQGSDFYLLDIKNLLAESGSSKSDKILPYKHQICQNMGE